MIGKPQQVIIIGDSPATADAGAALEADSWSVHRFGSIAEGRDSLATGEPLVVILDPSDIGLTPERALQSVRLLDPDAAIVLLVDTDEPTDFQGYRRPAAVVAKPIDRAALLMAADSALVLRRLLDENQSLKRQLGQAVSLTDWVGCTPESLEIRKAIATAALTDGPVLIVGEDGTGRRLAAELLHRHGRHASQSFLAVDLASLSEGDLGALLRELNHATRQGRFGQASVGTLYLAELTALGPVDQGALRDVLSAATDFRIIASADPNIREPMNGAAFDIKTLQLIGRRTIEIPALRSRRGDIPVLIDHFLKKYCERFELQPLGIPSSAIEHYSRYDWPGNVGELSMLIERAISIASAAKFDGTTLPEHFCAPPSLTIPEPARLRNVSLKELIADIEKRIIVQTLERVDGSQKKAAEQLRLNPTTLHEKMKRYKLLPERPRSRV